MLQGDVRVFTPERLSSGNYRIRVLDYVDCNKKGILKVSLHQLHKKHY